MKKGINIIFSLFFCIIAFGGNKAVERSEWLGAIDKLSQSFTSANATKFSGQNIYFESISNGITAGNEHKFIEDRLVENLKGKGVVDYRQGSQSPFPKDEKNLILSGNIENSSLQIDGENRLAYVLRLKLTQNGNILWQESATLLPRKNELAKTNSGSSTTIIISGAPRPYFRHFARPRGAVIINGNGIVIAPPPPHGMRPPKPFPAGRPHNPPPHRPMSPRR